MENNPNQHYRKKVETIRFFGSIILDAAAAITGNLVLFFSIAVILGLIDLFFVRPKVNENL
ncbi:hypothetical protein LC087_17975 [Bacillus carboniphilus]|uniref:Uncharacterized protein n=1 Tax=Bacillus carboniphilus TaxID=86663 RepID=A0ABY9JT33_9BACI|nr:hypothetical protein [Bacillus carboniphilus]WLR42549.1 hypothetical protein LC087_17975 [Bacillus carboniphilus]